MRRIALRSSALRVLLCPTVFDGVPAGEKPTLGDIVRGERSE